jgi:hypothetical protein
LEPINNIKWLIISSLRSKTSKITLVDAPGAPDAVVILTPATLPDNALKALVFLAFTTSSPPTVVTA